MQCLWRIVYIQHEAHAALVLKLVLNKSYRNFVRALNTILAVVNGTQVKAELLSLILRLIRSSYCQLLKSVYAKLSHLSRIQYPNFANQADGISMDTSKIFALEIVKAGINFIIQREVDLCTSLFLFNRLSVRTQECVISQLAKWKNVQENNVPEE